MIGISLIKTEIFISYHLMLFFFNSLASLIIEPDQGAKRWLDFIF